MKRRRGWDITAGGVWVFEPTETEVPALPPPDHPACTVDAQKIASPGTLVLGEAVSVTLRAEGDCPGHHEPQQLVLAMDTSWSMHDLFYPESPRPGALRRAQEVMSALLAAIDPSSVEIGLVTFSAGARVDVPLPGDLGDVRTRLLTRRADGDSFMGAGVALAHQELIGPAGRRDRRQTILIISDGLFHDEPKAAVDAARADGIEVAVLVMTTEGLDDEARTSLERIVGDRRFLFVDPLPETAGRLVDRVSTWVPNARLFEHAQVEDRDNVQAPDRPRRLAHVADRAGAKDGGVAMGDREDGAGQGGAMTEENGLRRACGLDYLLTMTRRRPRPWCCPWMTTPWTKSGRRRPCCAGAFAGSGAGTRRGLATGWRACRAPTG